ncbi:MAG: PaaI family thioesterase [Butyrivibrio sp.]|uniref:PaaI family thioesterase n=1 Tax=Butyrivibrio sp. TaxID=28121 RepID=UPI0025D40E02|nr:PaaI family thioesterase [Butyrivibrio sp.]MCR5771167.1 PaaI family thioesterase [Butyrivibrio sp.]
MRTLDEIRDFFAKDKYATEVTGIEIIKAEPGHSQVRLTIDDRHMNAVGSLMGAVFFTMADFAFAVAVNSDIDSEYVTVTLQSSISFMRTVNSGTLTAKADLVRDGRSTCVYEICIYSDDNKELCRVITTGSKIRKK